MGFRRAFGVQRPRSRIGGIGFLGYELWAVGHQLSALSYQPYFKLPALAYQPDRPNNKRRRVCGG